MENNNEVSMFMDVKLDVHDRRLNTPKFKQWTRCQVKIEAVKCLPSYMRVTFQRCRGNISCPQDIEDYPPFSVSIIVPGLTISLATSRTKLYSYGLFWTQHRKRCFIYLSLESEATRRNHMKWVRRSIKILEEHRQMCLEQRRMSRDQSRDNIKQCLNAEQENKSEVEPKPQRIPNTLGWLPEIPNAAAFAINDRGPSWSRVSEIYEEIYEGVQAGGDAPRLSRRVSRASVASGIYEEMKPLNGSQFNSIAEENYEIPPAVPPLPPFAPPRKRLNTFESGGFLGEIPRSNTNPDTSELAKKKKYKNILDNFFGGGRSKRAASVSESQACSVEDLLITPPPKQQQSQQPIYINDAVRRNKHTIAAHMAMAKRNSFSSPDLSKINFLENNEENSVVAMLREDSSNNGSLLNLSNTSLRELSPVKSQEPLEKPDSLESLNISEQISHNFNFSACNTSSINLVGANGAALQQSMQKNKILVDDVTGYCIMAPIIKKATTAKENGEQISSGYSTGSYSTSSTTSTASYTKSNEEKVQKVSANKAAPIETPAVNVEDSVVYEHMYYGGNNSNNSQTTKRSRPATPAKAAADFTDNLYENLLAVKAAQELEQSADYQTANNTGAGLSSSTPTESPATAELLRVPQTEEESFYQTPRKSVISVDEKIPSYYPNSCDTVKMRRTSPLKANATPTSSGSEKNGHSMGLRQIVSMNMRRERKENLYISSPQSIIEQRRTCLTGASPPPSPAAASKKPKSHKNKMTAAHKISEHVYAVKHGHRKSANNNNNNNNAKTSPADKDKLQAELLQLAVLQQIDFKFDDNKPPIRQSPKASHDEALSPQPIYENCLPQPIYESCLQPTDSATRLLQKYAALATKLSPGASQAGVGASSSSPMTQSKVEVVCTTANGENVAADDVPLSGSAKKFTSLPRFKKIDFSPLRLKINNVLQRNSPQQDF